MNEELKQEMLKKNPPNIENLDKESILEDEIFDYLIALPNSPDKTRTIEKIRTKAREFKVISAFNSIYKQKNQEYIQYLKSRGGNLVKFTDCPIENLKCGQWNADDTGVYKMDYTTTMQPLKIKASSIPILPTDRIVNIDTQTEKIKLMFYKDNKWNEIIVEKNTIVSKAKIIQLANKGIEVTDENAKNLINYLADVLELNAFKPKKGITHLGWINDEFMPYTDKYIYDGDTSFRNIFESVKTKGDYGEWKKFITRFTDKSKTIRFVISASFASPLVKIFNINSFMVHLWGTSGKGKTVTQMVAASVWGNPAKGKLLSTLNNTKVASERLLNFLRNLPFIPDELQTIKSTFKGDFEDMIYNFTEGKGKDRGTVDGGLRETTEWDNISILSGEEPITANVGHEGTKNRVIEIEENASLVDDGIDVGNDVVNFIYDNHGDAGKEFIQIIQKMDKEDLYRLRNEYVTELNKITKYSKQINAMSVILVADYIVSKYILHRKPLEADDVKEYFRNDTDEADRIMEVILNLAESNINNFYDYSKTYTPSGQVWGELDKAKDGNNGTIFNYNFIPNILYEELEKRGINWNSVKNKLANKGYIEKRKNGEYTIPIKSYSGQKQRFIKVKNIHNVTEENE